MHSVLQTPSEGSTQHTRTFRRRSYRPKEDKLKSVLIKTIMRPSVLPTAAKAIQHAVHATRFNAIAVMQAEQERIAERKRQILEMDDIEKKQKAMLERKLRNKNYTIESDGSVLVLHSTKTVQKHLHSVPVIQTQIKRKTKIKTRQRDLLPETAPTKPQKFYLVRATIWFIVMAY